ncbi:sigma-70 family RNA polymerase sigma factor [Robertkochia marina]|uniref:Sigma-70 family RNA polymerase sigma factor n=1 Tax=Robertkochia marina TaxID=1227945 RepID=A0A4S3LX60_9FLAO|nr:sigma-70 family RNA polymerase sigma factor [Robertkochia marina]THD65776.1 sigma-70 family RNA polymerase sigma factor [Robertkochia marina]TRZ46540.1 sigma-70 family RNA polymerase sigma factor [Robertkochia marina]
MFQSDLIEKCRRNDRRAQMQLYDKYCDAMYAVSMRYLKDGEDAKDVTQEAFIKAFRNLGQFRGEVTFGAWLKRIVINKSIDFLKSRAGYHESLDEGYLQVADEEGEDWTVDDSVSVTQIKDVMETLSEKYRYVLMLYLIEGYDHQEISEILNITENTSRTQLLRGKRKLKDRLKHLQHGTGY